MLSQRPSISECDRSVVEIGERRPLLCTLQVLQSPRNFLHVGSICCYPKCRIYQIRNLVFAPRMSPHFLTSKMPLPDFFHCSNGRQTVGDGAFTFDNEPSVLAVCHMQGADDMYYYSTTFSGGPGVCSTLPIVI